MNNKLVTLLVASLMSAGAMAIPPELSGESVHSIEAENGIAGWSTVDSQRVLLNLDEQDSYLLTLKHQCVGLTWAQNITVTMSNNTIWAGFDAIEADGRACAIDSIEKINPKDL
ncbi:MAG: DUF6491 family protein [Pseudomonadota bacterium]